MLGALSVVVEVLTNLRGRDKSDGLAVRFLGMLNAQDDGITVCLNASKSVPLDMV